jgi:hypothetical protein
MSDLGLMLDSTPCLASPFSRPASFSGSSLDDPPLNLKVRQLPFISSGKLLEFILWCSIRSEEVRTLFSESGTRYSVARLGFQAWISFPLFPPGVPARFYLSPFYFNLQSERVSFGTQNEVYCSSTLRIQNHSAASLSFHKSSIKLHSSVTHTKHEALQPHPLLLSSLVLSNPNPSSAITPKPFHGIKTSLPFETPVVRTTYLDLPSHSKRDSPQTLNGNWPFPSTPARANPSPRCPTETRSPK